MVDIGLIQAVVSNPWAQCAFSLTVRFILVGVAWLWILPESFATKRSGIIKVILLTALASVIGVVFSLFSALLLCETGNFSPRLDNVATILLVLTGLMLGAVLARERLISRVLRTTPGALLFFLIVSVIMNLSDRGEWVIGGLDPGIYINQGIAASETGTFYPEPSPCYKSLDAASLMSFSRGRPAYRECFPGIPVDINTGRFVHYFFRLTPSAVAVMARSGGVRAATRVNMIFGILACLSMFAFLAVNRSQNSAAFFAVILLIAQPIWMYVLGNPVSEMLQLFLICSIGTLIFLRKESIMFVLLLALSILAALINRMSFMPFAGLLILAVSWLDLERSDRGRVIIERVILLIALLAGSLFDATVSSITLAKIKVMDQMVGVAVVASVLAVLLDLIAMKISLREKLVRSEPMLVKVGFIVSVLGAIAFMSGVQGSLGSVFLRIKRTLPYIGVATVLAAFLGGACLCWDKRHRRRGQGVFVVYLFAVTSVILVWPGIKEIYPYALRRYLPYTVPAIVVLAGSYISFIWSYKGSYTRAFKCLALLLAIALVLDNAKTARHAFKRTEHNGVSELLQELADQIGDDDIIVSDHPWWGTPLTFVYGKQVLNGRHMYARKNNDEDYQGVNVLKRLEEEGKNVRFLTSTTKGMDIFPLKSFPRKVRRASVDFSTGEVVIKELVHSRRADDFVLRDRHYEFRLYTWK